MENLISHISELIIRFSDFVWEWNAPFLVGAGIYFLIFSKLTPFKYIRHAFDLIRGKHTKQEDIGEVTHFQALTTALSGTIGLGNISGVALAIGYGGPGVKESPSGTSPANRRSYACAACVARRHAGTISKMALERR